MAHNARADALPLLGALVNKQTETVQMPLSPMLLLNMTST